MKKRNIGYISVGLIFIIGIVYFWIASGNDFLQRYPTESFNNMQYYQIYPETILSSLVNDESPSFQLKPDSSLEKLTEMPVSWSQADYAEIAHEASEYAWKESLDDWNLYRMVFSASCHDNPIGFDSAGYVYFKEILFNGRRLYTARGIFITPQYGDMTLGSDTNFPRPLWGWRYVRKNIMNVTADEALRLAESKGGEGARLSMQNICQIYVSMNPNGYGHNNWKVSYTGDGNLADFEIIIPSEK